ncbi:hypothetical protein SLOPH_1204 [Spraguea lophii 42_110]|uniref:Uncharacterized protein n=1 Tax=Spraguea lophii (strain 42_110) TaxID=1358809 RepID=S7XVC7_SPRLO|nr:hypothetical protein SLOPH_1204 [Spraguea lophii 42_110]
MEEVFRYVDELSIRKVIFMLESKKFNVLDQICCSFVEIPTLGRVKDQNLLQYVVGRYIQNECGDMWNIAMQVYRRCGYEQFSYEDSGGNNILHYFLLIGDINIIKDILKKDCPIKKNINGIHPIDLCRDEKLLKLMQNWSKTSNVSAVSTIVSNDVSNVSEKVSKYRKGYEYMTRNVDFNLVNHEPHDEKKRTRKDILEQKLENEIVDGLNKLEEINEEKFIKNIGFECRAADEICEGEFNEKVETGFLDDVNSSLDVLISMDDLNDRKVEDKKVNEEKIETDNNIEEESLKTNEESMEEENMKTEEGSLKTEADSNIEGDSKTKEDEKMESKYTLEIEKRKTEIEKAEKRDNSGISHYLSMSDLRMLQQGNLPIENLQVNMFPGKVYLEIEKINMKNSVKDNIGYLDIQIIQNNRIVYSRSTENNEPIEKFGFFELDLNNKDLDLRIEIKSKFTNGSNKIKNYFTEIIVPKKELTLYQNKRKTATIALSSHNQPNIFKLLKNLFIASTKPFLESIRYSLTYIAIEDLRMLNRRIVQNNDLLTWIQMRHHYFTIWYKGYANCRGNKSPCTLLWMRRYIIWRGYTISLFNEFSGTHIGDIYINDSKYTYYDKDSTDFITENSFKLESSNQSIEINLDNHARFENCLAALSLLFD